MTTKVIFNVNKAVKEKAMKVAKAQGITISDYLNMALVEFAEGKKSVGIVDTVNQKTITKLKKAYKEIEQGKHDSPTFPNGQDALKWLHSK